MIRTYSLSPAQCTTGELDDFRKLLFCRGEINFEKIERRISRCRALTFCVDDDLAVGITAMKKPSKKTVEKLERLSGVALPVRNEVGWAFVLESHRGCGIAGLMLSNLLEFCGKTGVFSITRVNNCPARASLVRNHFDQRGSFFSWNGAQTLLYLYNVPRRMVSNPDSDPMI